MNSARVPAPVGGVCGLSRCRSYNRSGLPAENSRKSKSNQGQQGLSERVPRRSVVLLAFSRYRSYNRSLLPTRKALKEPTSDERGAFLHSVVFPAFFGAHFVRTENDFMTYNRLASSTLSDAGSISRGSFPDDPLPVRYAFLSSRPYLFGSFPYPIS